MLKLIDISSHQDPVNFDAVKRAGYEGVIVKATGGDRYINEDYRWQIAGARSVGLVVGHYHYDAEPTIRTGTAEAEAAHFLAHSDVRPGELVALDAEERRTRDAGRYRTWLNIVERAEGVAPLFYTFQSFLTELPASVWLPLARFPLWYAWYPDSGQSDHFPFPPAPWERIALWQYSGGHSVPGIDSATDGNVYAGDRSALVALGKPYPRPAGGDESARLWAAYRALPDLVRGSEAGSVFYEFGADFSAVPGAPVAKGHGLHSEYVTLWTADGEPVRPLQPGLYDQLIAAGKIAVYR